MNDIIALILSLPTDERARAGMATALCSAYRQSSVIVTGNPEASSGFALQLAEWIASDPRSQDDTPREIAEACEDAPEATPHDYTASAYYAGIHALSSSLITEDPSESIRLLAASIKMLDEVWMAAEDLRRTRGTRPDLAVLATPPRPDLAEVLLALDACDEDEADAVPWARPYGGDWERALAECRHRDWLLWLAGRLLRRGHLRAEVLVATACACARSVLHLVPAYEERPRVAIETAERWASGRADEKEVRAAREGADFAAATVRYGSTFRDAARAAADAARAAAVIPNAAAAADAARAAGAHAAWATDGRSSEVTDLVKRELGPALLAGLEAYAATLPGASR